MNEQQIDANTVIKKLSDKLSEAYVTIAIMESQFESLQQKDDTPAPATAE